MSDQAHRASAQASDAFTRVDKGKVSWIPTISALLEILEIFENNQAVSEFEGAQEAEVDGYANCPRGKDHVLPQSGIQPEQDGPGEPQKLGEIAQGIRLLEEVDPGLYRLKYLAELEPAQPDDEDWPKEWDEEGGFKRWLEAEGLQMFRDLPQDIIQKAEALRQADQEGASKPRE
ncbi:hypothetical protein FZEAL_7070 [Fusarium zealandicum]|uniref:Uncharacterized protein n=1 Tax=Fusarium zealandicum TaxID=1053134 RepID=A0A8H4UGI0_9HYPO|nr:hypothetical protein FZEAL_7070 [Fusarium zealandicum]